VTDPRLTLVQTSAPGDDPNSPAYVRPEDVRVVNTSPWTKAEGGWRWRTFGDELQLRSLKLPHVPIDLLRNEAIHLLRSLEAALEVPRSKEYRLSLWQRLSFWWSRAVWNRKHHAMLEASRREVVKFYARNGPWP
jgi:hypothetical protein